MLDLRASASALVLMYVISGLVKVGSCGQSEAARLAAATGTTTRMATVLVLLAGMWELYASALVLWGVWQRDKHSLAYVQTGASLLFVFTVIVSVVFYMRPVRYKPLLANLTALAALSLLPRVCELKSM